MTYHTLLAFASSFMVSPLPVLASPYSITNASSTTYQFQEYGAKSGDDGKKTSFSYSIAQVPRFNSRVKIVDNEGRRLHSAGIWNEAGERLRFRAGQGIHTDLGFLVSWNLFSTWVPNEQSDEKQVKSSPESETRLPKAETCQAAVDRVLGLIRSKGAKFTQFRVYRNVGIEYYENPTSRSDKIIIDLRDTMVPGPQIVAQKILNKQEMQAWANRIASSCGNTGIVTFGIYGTDGYNSYFFHGDGTMKEAICREPDRSSYEKKYKWGVELCL